MPFASSSVQDSRIVAEHPRSFGRGETINDPWHYVPVLTRKPGALRNGAPIKDWVLPVTMDRIRRRLAGADDGNRQMVDILTTVLTDGLAAVEAACSEAMTHGVHSADVVLNILARQRNPAPPVTILTPAALTLRQAREDDQVPPALATSPQPNQLRRHKRWRFSGLNMNEQFFLDRATRSGMLDRPKRLTNDSIFCGQRE